MLNARKLMPFLMALAMLIGSALLSFGLMKSSPINWPKPFILAFHYLL
jgi:hypothetical protein